MEIDSQINIQMLQGVFFLEGGTRGVGCTKKTKQKRDKDWLKSEKLSSSMEFDSSLNPHT